MMDILERERTHAREREMRKVPALKRKSRIFVREDRAMRENLTQNQIDKILADSFPASDPPPWH